MKHYKLPVDYIDFMEKIYSWKLYLSTDEYEIVLNYVIDRINNTKTNTVLVLYGKNSIYLLRHIINIIDIKNCCNITNDVFDEYNNYLFTDVHNVPPTLYYMNITNKINNISFYCQLIQNYNNLVIKRFTSIISESYSFLLKSNSGPGLICTTNNINNLPKSNGHINFKIIDMRNLYLV